MKMKVLLLFLLYLSSPWTPSFGEVEPVHVARSNINSRIIGGQNARAGQFPFAVAFYVTTALGRYFCGGSLISNEWILTAGHCVSGGLQYTITLGSNTLSTADINRQTAVTNSSFLHPEFDNLTLQYDVGLIHLNTPALFSDYVGSIFLPTTDLQNDANVYVIGWGQIDDYSPGPVNHLNYVTATTLSDTTCSAIFGSQIAANSVCVGGSYNQGTCLGDSGTPLIRYVLNERHAEVVGVSSFISQRGCESTDPSGYAKVFNTVQWIRNVTGIV